MGGHLTVDDDVMMFLPHGLNLQRSVMKWNLHDVTSVVVSGESWTPGAS